MPGSPTDRPALVVMVKAPRPGRVKTRLASDLGVISATWWYRHQTRALLRRLRDPRWHLVVALSPDGDPLHRAAWPADLAQIPQGTGDLGQRMARLFQDCPGNPVLIIGSDIPCVRRPLIADSFERLRGHDGVICPSEDGGFWCIGLRRGRRLPKKGFSGVRWSTGHALADTLRCLRPLRIAQGRVLRDVDTAADLRRTQST